MATVKLHSERRNHRETINLTADEHEKLLRSAREVGLAKGTLATRAFKRGLDGEVAAIQKQTRKTA